MLKRIWDASRAVDLLQSLDCVDPDRIGMIGHSLGAGTTFWAMAHDERIRAGVIAAAGDVRYSLNASSRRKPFNRVTSWQVPQNVELDIGSNFTTSV